jgi:hypothetical protein
LVSARSCEVKPGTAAGPRTGRPADRSCAAAVRELGEIGSRWGGRVDWSVTRRRAEGNHAAGPARRRMEPYAGHADQRARANLSARGRLAMIRESPARRGKATDTGVSIARCP